MKFCSFFLFLLSSFSLLGSEAALEIPAIPEPQGKFDPLLIAAWRGDVKSTISLVQDMGALVTSTGPHGITALHLASVAGRSEAVQVLLGLGANIDALTKKKNGFHSFEIDGQRISMQGGKSSLYYAVQNKHLQVASNLVASGAKYKKSGNLLDVIFLWKEGGLKQHMRKRLKEAKARSAEDRESLRQNGRWVKKDGEAIAVAPPGRVERAPASSARVLRAEATVIPASSAESEVAPARLVRIEPHSLYGAPSAPYLNFMSPSAVGDEFSSSAPASVVTVVNIDDQMSP